MRHLVLVLVLVSAPAHAEYTLEDFNRDGNYGNQLAPILEVPTHRPVEPEALDRWQVQEQQELESSRAMDLELRH